MTDPLYDDVAFTELYDAQCPWGPPEDFFFRLAGPARGVLDLGCGTGRMAVALAAGGRAVTGVDPARGMLTVARGRPGSQTATFVEGDARSVRLGQRFDVVMMAGHAFQILLSAADRLAVFETIAAHLRPEGRFAFDSRNPLKEEWRTWTPEASLERFEHPRHGAISAWHDARMDAKSGIVTYDSFYRFEATGRTIAAPNSPLAFPSRESLVPLLARAGLEVTEWIGDWDGSPWTPQSREIIPVGRLSS